MSQAPREYCEASIEVMKQRWRSTNPVELEKELVMLVRSGVSIQVIHAAQAVLVELKAERAALYPDTMPAL